MMKKLVAAVFAAVLILQTSLPAAAAEGVTYVALGADLTSDQRETVLELLEVSADDLDEDHLVTVTNEEEHEYLDDYLEASVIGTKALSSVAVTEEETGYGIQVTTHNITYCTTGMYQNALATAGLENAKVVVAGPFGLSGTAGLIGAIKAYDAMSGKTIDPENIEAATQELVVTEDVADVIGSDDAESLIGAVKNEIAAENITDEDDIRDIINDTAEKMDITLTDEQVEQILSLMKKISGLNLDVDQLKQQASDLYEKLSGMGIDLGEDGGKAQGFLAQLLEKIRSFFNM